MNDQSEARADAIAFSRDLERCPDPLSLYAALSENGEREGCIFFEQADGPAFILDSAALRIECRGEEVELAAISANGRRLLLVIAGRHASHLISKDAERLRFRFPKIDSPDCEDRLKGASPFDMLRVLTVGLGQEGSEPFGCLSLGVIAFDHADLFETLPEAAENPLDFPDFLFFLAESLIAFEPGKKPRAISTAFGCEDAVDAAKDASDRLADLVSRAERAERAPAMAPAQPAARLCSNVQADLDDRAFAGLVSAMKAHIAAGEVYQIVISRTFSAPCALPFEAFRALMAIDRGPYNFFMPEGAWSLFGASPETSVRVFDDKGLNVELKPIAGTRGRGRCGDEDDRLEAELRLDPKECAEHMMLLDLARNDVARISEKGSRRVAQMMAVERYAKVMHLVSRVTGKLRAGLDAVDALKSCLNMGTLTGAPKIRATGLLRQAERTKRGPYGGAIGWLSGTGELDSAIVIRSAFVKAGTAFVRAGAGIVHDSDPEEEAKETRRKAAALLSVLGGVDE